MEPNEPVPDDDRCTHCNAYLPTIYGVDDWTWHGFCGPACCLNYLLTVAGVNRGISGADAILGRRAIAALVQAQAAPD